MNSIASVILLFNILLYLPLAAEPAHPFFIGNYEATGRTCYGMVQLTPKRFSWKAPFCYIQNAKYHVVYQSISNTSREKRIVIQLVSHPKKWRYPIVCLEQNALDTEYSWGIEGFRSMEDFKAFNLGDAFACPLIKVDELDK